MTSRIALILSAVLLPVAAATPVSADPDDGQEAAIAAIRRLGGSIQVDEQGPTKAVIAVDLEDTDAKDSDIELLKTLSRLRSLNLKRTDVTNAGLEHVKELTGLEILNLILENN